MVKKINISLIVVNTLFAIYYLALAYFNRMSQDDWLFHHVINEIGACGFLHDVYMHQSGRLIGYAMHCVNYSLFSVNVLPHVMPIISYLLASCTIYLTLRLLQSRDKWLNVSLSFFMTNLFIIANFEFSSFYWCCASLGIFNTSLWVYLFVLLARYRNKVVDNVQIILLLFYKMTSSEVFTPLFAGLLFLLLAYQCIRAKSFALAWQSKQNRWILASIIVLLIGTIIILVAPGNYERAAEEMYVHSVSLLGFVKCWMTNILLYFYLLSFKGIYFVATFVAFVVVGLNHPSPIAKDSQVGMKQLFIIVAILYFAFITLATAPMAYLMSGLGFQRYYIPCIFVAFALVAIIGWHWGESMQNSSHRRMEYIHMGLCALLSAIVVVRIVHDVPRAHNYARAFDKRLEIILTEKANGRTELLELERLPHPRTITLKSIILTNSDPVFYYADALTTDPDSYESTCLATYFSLPFKIALKE